MTSKLNTWLGGVFMILFLISCDTTDSDIQELRVSFTVDSEKVEVGSLINFSDTSSGTDQSTMYEWDFGDGASSTSKTPTHVYREIGEGSYVVTLTLKRNGEVASASQELLVFLENDIANRISLSEKLEDNEIIVCAHRAKNETGAPENSIAAINNAISKGIEMIEVDVRVTSDGELVLMHDSTIDRTTEGSGNVSDFTLEELKEFRLFNDSGVLTNERIPTLKEVLSLTRGKLYIDLDIANKVLFDKIYPIVNQYGMLNQVIFFASDNIGELNNMLEQNPNVIAMPLVNSQSDLNNYADLNLNVVHYTSATFTQSLVQQAKDKGWFIFMNAYVNSSSPEEDNFGRIDRIIALEGNIVQTDYPVSVKQHIN
ncbi:hypothetical protein BFP77_05785 [Maribacter sp. 4U21]|uniref:glycerophosphodiester phosphodiesterase family protein n=1 Tax=Maribacter sp. 4U21 TaxID=1889779 RepID=UPI000C152B19|nr:glycerophosphodiester phosphodiesterase family protein [Maribacter sp. 4U21]PIB29655.1 hypothetical protein BFP77_05785 [Maribacter sp. 4U21]